MMLIIIIIIIQLNLNFKETHQTSSTLYKYSEPYLKFDWLKF